MDGGILICFESYSIKFAQQQYSRNREIKQQRLSFRDEMKKGANLKGVFAKYEKGYRLMSKNIQW